MTCDQFNEIHQVYLDGLLKKLPRAAESHTKKCPDCASKLQGLSALHESLSALRAPELSLQGESWLKRRVRERIETANRNPAFGIRFKSAAARLRWSRVGVLATACVLILAVIFSTARFEEPAPEPLLVEEELEIFLEEHSLQQQHNLFHPNAIAEPMLISASVSNGKK